MRNAAGGRPQLVPASRSHLRIIWRPLRTEPITSQTPALNRIIRSQNRRTSITAKHSRTISIICSDHSQKGACPLSRTCGLSHFGEAGLFLASLFKGKQKTENADVQDILQTGKMPAKAGAQPGKSRAGRTVFYRR